MIRSLTAAFRVEKLISSNYPKIIKNFKYKISSLKELKIEKCI